MKQHPFESLGIDEDFNPYYKEQEIKAPNHVQKKVIPKIMEDKSVLCVAQTGTGKTLAYALPISELIKCIEDEHGLSRKRSKPQAIIIAPTKELVVQIEQVFKDISHHVKLRIRSLIGGQRNKMTKSLKDQSYEILVATPNKLLKLVKNKEVHLTDLKYLVFDEADTLFDMGFKKDIEGLLHNVKYDNTAVHLFSATLPASIEEFLVTHFKKKELEKITFSESHKVQGKVETFNIYVSPKEKLNMVRAFVQKTAKGRGIIFANQKNHVDEITEFLKKEMPTLKFRSLHGDMTQKDRLAAHKSFVDKKSQILVATDVAARGIDIKDLKWVFNYSLPRSAEFYLHRSGRTARAGKKGLVYNLVTHFDSKMIGFINEAIKKQSNLDLEFISQDIIKASDKVKAQAVRKKASKKVKTKRVKITKRTRFS
jgi:superfamily II DNA/RNA helicase